MAGGLLKVVSNQELEQEDRKAVRLAEEVEQELSPQFTDQLAHHIRQRYYDFRRHKIRQNLHRRMLHAQRAYNGQYDTVKLNEIKKFGGSDVYARLTAIKARGATAMLRDVYLSGERPWDVEPTPVPDLPGDIMSSVDVLISSEVKNLVQNGQEPDPMQVQARRQQLMKAARQASEKEARDKSKAASAKIEDVLVEGNFYGALAEFLIDLPVFPFAVMKGPIVQMARSLTWDEGAPKVEQKPRMYWRRVSPFNFYWTPAASSIEEADVIERIKLRRSDLQALIGVPGYDPVAVMAALSDYTTGLYDNLDDTDTEQAYNEDKENPSINDSYMIDSLEFQGEIQGEYLQTWNGGAAIEGIKDFNPAFDYNVVCWVVGRHTIKAQVQPNPRQRHNYFGTSFEKVSGSLVGRALPEILDDSQHVANAAFRSLVNNMGMASGPQVAINEDRMSPTMNSDHLEPWKRWRFTSDPLGNSEKPIEFFQPASNANELMGVFDKMMVLGDEVSGIPRYMTGNQNVGGAAATASGLNQLMNNASKVLQQVAAQVDQELLTPLLEYLHAMVMLTDDTGLTWGDVNIRAYGVTMAMSRESDRQRQLEFLQLTANPLDQGLVGPRGRAVILRELADNLGLDGESIVPSEEEIAAQEEAAARAMQAQQAAQAQGNQSQKPGAPDSRPNRGLDNAQRTRTPQAIASQATP